MNLMGLASGLLFTLIGVGLFTTMLITAQMKRVIRLLTATAVIRESVRM
jgi:hypothetical protein